jgi:hypothetical protein
VQGCPCARVGHCQALIFKPLMLSIRGFSF